MTDPLSVAGFALSLTKSATEALNALREHSKTTKDLDIKDQINTLYDIVLELKEVISRLSDENKNLKQQLDAQNQPPEVPELKQVGEANYYYRKNGDGGFDGPYCQPCYDDKHKLVAVTPAEDWNRGVRRQCLVCKTYFYEKKMQHNPSPRINIKPY